MPALTSSPTPNPPRIQRTVTAPELANALAQLTPNNETRRVASQSDESVQHSEATNIDDLDSPDLESGERIIQHRHAQSATMPTPDTHPARVFPNYQTWRTYFMQEVAGDTYLELQLLLMTVVTGCLDAMTYTTFSVFTSKQTGNVLFLALHAFSLPSIRPGVEKNVGTSMAVFVAGAVFFGHLGHISRQRRRIWLLASNTFQALLMLAAAALRYWSSRNGTGPGAIAIIALLSFAESGQISNALNVSMPELNTTMITGALIQLCTDRDIFKLHNAKRNRRLAFFASLMLGCFIGAAVLANRSPSAVLVVVAGTKGALVLSFFFNRGLIDKKSRLEDGTEKVEGTATPAGDVLWGDGNRTPLSKIIWGD